MLRSSSFEPASPPDEVKFQGIQPDTRSVSSSCLICKNSFKIGLAAISSRVTSTSKQESSIEASKRGHRLSGPRIGLSVIRPTKSSLHAE